MSAYTEHLKLKDDSEKLVKETKLLVAQVNPRLDDGLAKWMASMLHRALK